MSANRRFFRYTAWDALPALCGVAQVAFSASCSPAGPRTATVNVALAMSAPMIKVSMRVSCGLGATHAWPSDCLSCPNGLISGLSGPSFSA